MANGLDPNHVPIRDVQPNKRSEHPPKSIWGSARISPREGDKSNRPNRDRVEQYRLCDLRVLLAPYYAHGMSAFWTNDEIAIRTEQFAVDNVADFARHEAEFKDSGKRIVRALNAALKAADFSPHSVTWRVKKAKAYETKMRRDPMRPVQDLVGIRIITKFRDDAATAEAIVRSVLRVDNSTYVDKMSMLSSKEFGYTSLQFVGRLMPKQTETRPQWLIDEAHDFGWMGAGQDTVEIQIRSVLQHAWAEVDHDIVYKPKGFVSEAIKRRFALTAALLEMADENLDSIRNEIALNREDIVPDELAGDFVERFTETDRNSLALDKLITMALGLPFGRPLLLERELSTAVRLAGWGRAGFNALHRTVAIQENATLALRMAIVCTDLGHNLLMSEAGGHANKPALAFPGIGLYWLAIATGSLLPEHGGMQSIPDGRMAEWAVVSAYLRKHPDKPALEVRARYQAMRAPHQPDSFMPISLD